MVEYMNGDLLNFYMILHNEEREEEFPKLYAVWWGQNWFKLSEPLKNYVRVQPTLELNFYSKSVLAAGVGFHWLLMFTRTCKTLIDQRYWLQWVVHKSNAEAEGLVIEF